VKCPKCAYLGFETSDKCRNCGYDFSFTVDAPSPSELPLQDRQDSGSPLSDFDLAPETSRAAQPAGLELDRLFGAETAMDDAAVAASMADVTPSVIPTPTTVTPEPVRGSPLPFARGADEAPVAPPRPARPPLSVRRSTPDLARGRNRTARTERGDSGGLSLELEAAAPEPPVVEAPLVDVTAGLMMRLIAAVIDGTLLLVVNVAVVYFTLQIAGLELLEIGIIPPIPMLAFLVLLNAGYLIAFTVAAGQTIGKMATSIRVMGDDGERVDLTSSVLRALGCAISIATLGLGFLPAFFGGHRRALQDRLAGTRVVRV
jgi:uncharacterized RDD family membrane protein YckC